MLVIEIGSRISLMFPLLVWTLMSCLHAQTFTTGEAIPEGQAPTNPALLARLREVSNYEQFAAYWTTEAGWHTELEMRNSLSSRELTVTPVLRASDGTEVALPALTLQPSDTATIDLHEALLAAPQFAVTYGSVVFRYSAPVSRALYASVKIGMPGTPIMFHLDASTPPKNWERGSREGVWWLTRTTATAYLILTNTSDRQLQTQLSIYDSAGKPNEQKIILGSRQTIRLSMRTLLQNAALQGPYGGIRVDVPNGAAYLESAHLVYDESNGHSALMKMFDHDPKTTLSERSWGKTKRTNEWIIRAPMLVLSNPDPALAFPAETRLEPKVLVHNSTGKTYSARLTFHWRSATGSGTSAPVSIALKPRETQMVDVAAMQMQNTLPEEAHWALVEISAPVQPEELIAIASSYDETGRYGAQTPFNDQLASHWQGGRWEVDSTHNSIITAGNGGEEPVRARMTLFYNGGKDKYEIEQTLAPNEQMWIDVGKLIRNQVPDTKGKTLPSDLTFGAYQLMETDKSGIGNLFEGKLIVDKTYGHAAYGCMVCCGPAHGFMVFDPFGIGLGFTNNQGVEGVDGCTGSEEDMTGWYTNWWTGSTAIATANMSAITGQGIGSTTDTARGTFQWGDGQESRQCPTRTDTTGGGVNVKPTVTIQGTKNFVFVGSDPTVVGRNLFFATGTPTGGDFAWSAIGSGLSFNNSSAANVTITSSATSGSLLDKSITVNYSKNGQNAIPATRAITARLFRFLVQASFIQTAVFNGPGLFGYEFQVKYNIQTNPGQQLVEPGASGISVFESVEVVSSSLPGVEPETGAGATDANSQITDTLRLTNNQALPTNLQIVSDQELFVGGFFVRRNTLSFSSTSVTVTNNGPFI